MLGRLRTSRFYPSVGRGGNGPRDGKSRRTWVGRGVLSWVFFVMLGRGTFCLAEEFVRACRRARECLRRI